MEIYSTEEQQVEAIKDWWKKNGKSVIAGSVIGLAAVFGWRYFTDYQMSQKEAASDAFQAAVIQYTSPAADNSALNDYVMANQGKNNYAVLASLLLAKQLVETKDYSAAEQQLSWAVDNSPAELTGMLRLRLARVQAQQANYAVALDNLKLVEEAVLQGSVEMVRGDIYLQQGERDLARQSYKAALAAGIADLDPSVNLKLNDLTEADVNG